jgi:TrmH family RNA methyltransferase
LAVAFGNEAHGVSRKLKQAADSTLSIPVFGKAESLNVAASAAICLYEIVRQRRP